MSQTADFKLDDALMCESLYDSRAVMISMVGVLLIIASIFCYYGSGVRPASNDKQRNLCLFAREGAHGHNWLTNSNGSGEGLNQ